MSSMPGSSLLAKVTTTDLRIYAHRNFEPDNSVQEQGRQLHSHHRFRMFSSALLAVAALSGFGFLLIG